MNIFLIYGVASFLSLVIIFLIMRKAEYGYEDETGFHEDKPISYKERCLKALDDIIYKYENPFVENSDELVKEMFNTASCALCNIYYDDYVKDINDCCNGCPMANEIAGIGCTSFNSYKKAVGIYYEYLKESQQYGLMFKLSNKANNKLIAVSLETKNKFINALNKRRDFIVKLKTIANDLPEERFTPGGWKYLELDYND